ncbi:MAG: heavy metal translocating P-type ATPase, partial [Asticcacaulis sp.]
MTQIQGQTFGSSAGAAQGYHPGLIEAPGCPTTGSVLREAPSASEASAFVQANDRGEQTLELLVRGAKCAGCLGKIERGVGQMPGVTRARMNLTTGKLSVAWEPGRITPDDVVMRVTDLGYAATPFDPTEVRDEEKREGRRLAIALGVSAFGAMNAMMFTVPVWSGLMVMDLPTRTMMYWLAALVATPTALWSGMVFFESAWRSLRKGRANMDVPISLGILLTLGISFSETLLGGEHTYFEAAVSLIFLLLIGRFLDHQLRAKARSAARDLLALQVPVASRLTADGQAEVVPVREICVRDRIQILPGDRVPVDGRVIEGVSDLDTALVSGETHLSAAAPGTDISAGTLNLSGRLVMEATARSEDSTVAAIARLMEAGAQTRSKYVQWADKAAALYVPVVHTVAAVTLIGGLVLGLELRDALMRAVALLIITCPCALGLAVPAVQIVASGRLFRRGVLVKSGAALERLAEVNHVVFDKTGVLTEGRPTLTAYDPASLQACAVLARASRHPLAKAVVAAADQAAKGQAAKGQGAEIATDVTETAGMGVRGRVQGRWARLGRADYVDAVRDDRASGTELWFGFDGEPPVRFGFSDPLRPEAFETIAALEARGLKVTVLSGDVAAAVEGVAERVGINDWHAAQTPMSKADRLDALRAGGDKVLMVGDGLNDAAALSKAHASMAPGAAVKASQNAADLVYEDGRLSAVVTALDVARSSRSR